MTTEPHQPEETSEKKGFGKRQIIATVLTLGVLVLVFAVVFPQFANYQEAWDAIQDMSTRWIITLIVATVVVIVIYALWHLSGGRRCRATSNYSAPLLGTHLRKQLP